MCISVLLTVLSGIYAYHGTDLDPRLRPRTQGKQEPSETKARLPTQVMETSFSLCSPRPPLDLSVGLVAWGPSHEVANPVMPAASVDIRDAAINRVAVSSTRLSPLHMSSGRQDSTRWLLDSGGGPSCMCNEASVFGQGPHQKLCRSVACPFLPLGAASLCVSKGCPPLRGGAEYGEQSQTRFWSRPINTGSLPLD